MSDPNLHNTHSQEHLKLKKGSSKVKREVTTLLIFFKPLIFANPVTRASARGESPGELFRSSLRISEAVLFHLRVGEGGVEI
jgi:hypothetical protein